MSFRISFLKLSPSSGITAFLSSFLRVCVLVETHSCHLVSRLKLCRDGIAAAQSRFTLMHGILTSICCS